MNVRTIDELSLQESVDPIIDFSDFKDQTFPTDKTKSGYYKKLKGANDK